VSNAPAADHAVPGTGVTVRVERRDGRLDLGISGALDDTSPETVDAVLADLVEHGADSRTGSVRLLSNHPPDRLRPLPMLLADRLDLPQTRDLFQMRRTLPIADDDPARAGARHVALRPFAPSTDAEAWVRTNNRAFATHPDQGTQTIETLAATLAEPWVDLTGFLVTDDPDRPGELAGSCWTRIHPPTGDDPQLGEIFVIGVDPSQHGKGLGRTLVLAGLDHLAWSGVTTGMLYVEADNEPALGLYRKLGFDVHHRYRIRSR
jgi:mycothiol synthase